jgi:hypothetical protein
MVDIQVAGTPIRIFLSHLNLCICQMGKTDEKYPYKG